MHYSRSLLAGLLVLGLGIPIYQLVATSSGEKKIPVTTHSADARGIFLKGRQLVDNLRITDGNPFFKKAVEADTGFALAYLFLAQTAASGKEFFAALDQAVARVSGVSEGERLWILSTQAGAYAKADDQRKLLHQLVALYPDDERAHMLLGVFHFGQQDFKTAAAELQKSVDIAPDFAPAYNQLGYAYRFLGRNSEAEETFKKYTLLIPNDPNPYDSYAELLLKIGRFDDAIVQYDKALAVDGHFGNSYAGIACALAYQGKHTEALVTLDKAIAISRTDGEKRAALFGRTAVLADRGDLAGALKEMEKQYAIAKQGGDAAGMAGDLVFMGNILIEQGSGDAALNDFTKAREIIEASSYAKEVKENAALIFHYNAARAELARHDLAAADRRATAFAKGVEETKNPNQVRLVHELQGMIALEKKNYAGAVQELSRSNLQNPYNLYRLARAYVHTANKEKAKETMSQAAHFSGLPALNYAFIRMKAEKELETM